MKRFSVALGLTGLALATVLAWPAEPVLSNTQEPEGKAVFTDSGCQSCHSVSSVGLQAKIKSEKLKGPDLVDVGKRHEAEWIAKYLRGAETMNGKSHKKPFKGSDEELMALVDWLLEQKAE